jgi:Chemoreceptor zinc-binding domain
MSIFSKIMGLFKLSDTQREEVLKEINFYEAIEAHLAWRKRLVDYLAGNSTEDLQPQNICVDNRCVLGKWIHGAGKARFGEMELFQNLIDEHAKFHYCASKVVEAHQAGDKALADKLMHDSFVPQSMKTVTCLTHLHKQVEGKSAA